MNPITPYITARTWNIRSCHRGESFTSSHQFEALFRAIMVACGTTDAIIRNLFGSRSQLVFEFGDWKGFNFNFLRFTKKESTKEKEGIAVRRRRWVLWLPRGTYCSPFLLKWIRPVFKCVSTIFTRLDVISSCTSICKQLEIISSAAADEQNCAVEIKYEGASVL